MRLRIEAAVAEQAGGARVVEHGAGGEDLARTREMLDARSDVDRLAEIILALVEVDGDARPLVDADFQQQILGAPVLVELSHRLAHAHGRRNRSVWRREGCHDRVADRLDHGARLGGNDLVDCAEMGLHQIEGCEIADPLVKFGGAAQIREEEGEAGDLQPLVYVDRVGAVDIAEGLVGKQPLGGEERTPAAEDIVQGVIGDTDRGQGAHIRMVFHLDAQRTRLHGQRLVVPVAAIEDERQRPPLLGRLALDVDELRGMGHRLEDDDEFRRHLQRDDRLFAGRQFERLDHEIVDLGLVVVLGQIYAGAPVDLAEIFERRQLVRVVGLDVAYPRVDGEGHFHHLVERRLIAGGAERAGIGVALHGLQRGIAVKHTAAPGAEHIPRQLEEPEA
ncbi:hypothetical protein D9M68_503890 [compost metagenome]